MRVNGTLLVSSFCDVFSAVSRLISWAFYFLDEVMTPIVKSLPSYIKDSNQALEIFLTFNFSGENKIIFIMEITSLYTVKKNKNNK